MNLSFVKDWRMLAPAAGAGVVALAAAFMWMRKRPEDPTEMERQRRVYLNRVGRIVEGQVLEINDPAHAPEAAQTDASGHNGNGNGNHRSAESAQLVYYTCLLYTSGTRQFSGELRRLLRRMPRPSKIGKFFGESEFC